MYIIRDTVDAKHVLGASFSCVHPGNGNAYVLCCLNRGGTNQDLVVYRYRPPYRFDVPGELVRKYDGAGVDSPYQVTMGGCAIAPNGSVLVAYSAVPIGTLPTDKDSGFAGTIDVIVKADEKYPLLTEIQAQIAALATLQGVTVAGTAPPKAVEIPPVSAYPNAGVPYASNHQLLQNADTKLPDLQLLSVGWLYLRFNKLVAIEREHGKALAQIQDRLKALGLLV